MKIAEMKIAEIKIGERIRQNVGDISALAASIKAVGLLQPVLIDDQCRLVAGQRRIAAVQMLGQDTIPAIIVKGLDDAAKRLMAERDENTCRLDLTLSEKVRVGKRLEELERPKAKEREQAGKSSDGTAGGRGKRKPSSNLDEGFGGRTDEKVGSALGISKDSYRRAKDVIEKAAPELIAAMDAGQVSITAAHDLLHLPVDQQQKVVSEGKQAMLDAVRDMRFEKANASAGTKRGQANRNRVVLAGPTLARAREVVAQLDALLKHADKTFELPAMRRLVKELADLLTPSQKG